MIIQRQANVQTAGNPEADKVLIVLHGYGQLVQYFIRKFDTLYNDYLIVAPEGPHRFYLNGFSGRVGASWMTKEKRLWDIADNQAYIQQVVDTYGVGKEITILGFSQGGATATRFVDNTETAIHRLVIWAATYPDDVSIDPTSKWQNIKRHFVLGNEDPFFTTETALQALEKYQSLNFECHQFEGKHDIDCKVLTEILL